MLVDLIEVFHQIDLNHVKKLLAEHSIYAQVLNENTFEIGDVYALGQNGIQIRVDQKDHARARQVLKDAGYFSEKESSDHQFSFLRTLQEKLNSYKLTKGLNAVILFIGVIFLFIVFALILYLKIVNNINLSSDEDQTYCVTRIIYQEEELNLNTIPVGYHFRNFYGCPEKFTLFDNGNFKLPGIDSDFVRGTFQLNPTKDSILIQEANLFEEVFNGSYKIKTNIFGEGKLISDSTEIHFKHEEKFRLFYF